MYQMSTLKCLFVIYLLKNLFFQSAILYICLHKMVEQMTFWELVAYEMVAYKTSKFEGTIDDIRIEKIISAPIGACFGSTRY